MDPRALEQAEEAWERGERHRHLLFDAKTVAEKRDHWRILLDAHAEAFEKLDAGAGKTGPARGWYGRLEKRRKDDDLLRYLHHARNARYHGLNPVTRDANRGRVVIGGGVAFRGPVEIARDFAVQHGGKFECEPEDIRLQDVVDRGVTYQFPVSYHLLSLRIVPTMVAAVAFGLLRGILNEAKEFVL